MTHSGGIYMNGARSGWRREAASVALSSALAIGSIGCSSPFTDIVATNTEDVGPFEVVSASANDGGLTATVCIADAAHAEAVAAHVIEQRLNHGYASMTLH